MTDQMFNVKRAVVRNAVATLPFIGAYQSFTKSNGTIMARIYERLTKASRRREAAGYDPIDEQEYRRGVYDALDAIRRELVGV